MKKVKIIINKTELDKILNRLTKLIVKKYKDLNNLAIVGIHTNGVYLAQRIVEKIKQLTNKKIKLGYIDITFYRDDIGYRKNIQQPKDTQIDFNIDNKDILLIDDVLFTGRTVRAAMEQLLEIGRPKTISVLVLIDRGLRELPIYAEFVGKKIATTHKQQIELLLKETGGDDTVVIYTK
ncbi:MAG: bifunctional pyr operon transcriptional regulator/uracil phosphoribosyltransferase PyrR [Endomicrobia bacterium]|nr:bifunctional pyr operon transcriptional regulator/uracil phosphoribosyltransferase PyrR [Endomicrobiia bacterium]MDW8055887.1 bifunctional pyr operon transcriptional regulator/uracil phosphoribosyltransferase PyrR [Elusimicrobiota bacterium]